MDMLRRLLSPEYWTVDLGGGLGGLWAVYVLLAAAFVAGAALAASQLLRRSGFSPLVLQRQANTEMGTLASERALCWVLLFACLAGMGTVLGRALGWPGWSARIWPVSLLMLSLVALAACRLRRASIPLWLADLLRVLALDPTEPAAPAAESSRRRLFFLCAGFTLHLVGLVLVIGVWYHLPLWLAPLMCLALLCPQFTRLRSGRPLRLSALAPLLGAYAAVLLPAAYGQLGITIVGWQGLAFPNPFLSLFYTDGLVLAAAVHSLLCSLKIGARFPCAATQTTLSASTPTSAGTRPAATVAVCIVTLTLAWSGAVYFGKRTHGVTASDPYAYTQMAVDLAERGTLLHRFDLFQVVMPLGISWAPLQPVGYHVPRNAQGDCPSVWATGASVLLAAGYLLGGETGLYVTTPIIALLALAATWALAKETLHSQPRPLSSLVAALAVALTATSPEHVDRLLVPMADAPAQLFTVLTLFLALRGSRALCSHHRQAAGWFAASGLAFGWAYWVRHTQLVLVLPVLLAIVLAARHAGRAITRQAVGAACAFLATSSVAALPDILYRWQAFGGPFAVETTELPAMGLQHVGIAAASLAQASLAAGEWGYLFPLALIGASHLASKHRREAAMLGMAVLSVLLVHLTYQFVRLRDLLSVFPLVNIAIAYGAVRLTVRAQTQGREFAPVRPPNARHRVMPLLLNATAVTWVVVSLVLSRWTMLDKPWRPGWASFGYMRPEQRAAFERLEELTPPQGVIAASLNAGAVALYTGRAPIRPYDSWAEKEWHTFLKVMKAQNRPVYLLDDGVQMERFIHAQGERLRLVPIEALNVPIFGTTDREAGWLYRVESGE